MRKLIASTLFLTAMFTGCGKAAAPKGPPPPAPVAVATAKLANVPINLLAPGNAEAFSTVSIRPRVAGVIEQVLFREGQEVAKGAKIFQIDAQPFVVVLRNAEANHARARAQAGEAGSVAERNAGLLKDNLISQEQYERSQADAAGAAAVLKAAQAAVKSAQLELSYTTIHAPMGGRTGQIFVQPGDVVRVSDPVLVTVNQTRPIYVSFAVPERDLPEIREATTKGTLPVFAIQPDHPDQISQGKLVFIDNAINASSGTILLKGQFDNRDGRLWPGEFVNVSLRIGERIDAVTVPSSAVIPSQNGDMVYVVDNQLVAHSRLVKVDRTVNDVAVIATGLKAGEQVITDGQLRVAPEAKVQITKAEQAEKKP